MKTLIVLNYYDSTVHIYNTTAEIDEQYIESLGFDSKYIHWMIGDLEIIKHKEVLK